MYRRQAVEGGLTQGYLSGIAHKHAQAEGHDGGDADEDRRTQHVLALHDERNQCDYDVRTISTPMRLGDALPELLEIRSLA